MVGIVAALGVGIGAVGTLFGGFVSGFMNLQPWYAKPFAILGAMLAISGPSVLLAWLKLRQRTLGPVLEANGWAVNGRVRVNIPLGAALTDLKVLPRGARRSLDDPFEDRKARRRRRLFWTAAVLAAAAAVAAKILHLWPFALPSCHRTPHYAAPHTGNCVRAAPDRPRPVAATRHRGRGPSRERHGGSRRRSLY